MKYKNQIGEMDCFSTCFQNAIRHFGVEISPELKKRLQVFNSGIQCCPIFESEERIAEAYGRSIDKFMSEWIWSQNHHESYNWASHLLKNRIEIVIRNGPIEQKRLLIDSLKNGKVCICEINETGKNREKSISKHDILIVRCFNGKLEAHDPKIRDVDRVQNKSAIKYVNNPNGINLEIDCEYFFSHKLDIMKPNRNEYQQDFGYKFMIISKIL